MSGLAASYQVSPALTLQQDFSVTDPEELGASAPRGVSHQLTLLGKGRYAARRWRATSAAMIASRGWTNLGVTHRTGTGKLAFFTFVAWDDPPAVIHGRMLPPGTLAWCRSNSEVHSQSPSGGTWSNLCFPMDVVDQDWAALYRDAQADPRDTVEVISIPLSVQQQLTTGIEAAIQAKQHPPTLVHGLLRLVIERFAAHRQDGAEASRFQLRGSRPKLAQQIRIVDGLVAIGDFADYACPLAAVCADLGVSLRTLNASSNALLGMGAGQYLRRRRLHRVLAALRDGDVSVTDAATAQGFWDLGRFAGDYRTLFGCSPSETRRAAQAGATQRPAASE